MKYSILGILGLLVFGTAHAMALEASELDWSDLANDFVVQNDAFKGNWTTKQSWKGVFCHGAAAFQANVKGHISNLDFQLEEEGTMDAVGQIDSIEINLLGKYKSELSLCRTMQGVYPVVLERVDIKSKIRFKDVPGKEEQEVKVNIQETTFSGLHVVPGLPDYFESYLTKLVNAGMRRVWATTLGDWISAKLSEAAKKIIPHG